LYNRHEKVISLEFQL